VANTRRARKTGGFVQAGARVGCSLDGGSRAYRNIWRGFDPQLFDLLKTVVFRTKLLIYACFAVLELRSFHAQAAPMDVFWFEGLNNRWEMPCLCCPYSHFRSYDILYNLQTAHLGTLGAYMKRCRVPFHN
jgi:hypothetical protein